MKTKIFNTTGISKFTKFLFVSFFSFCVIANFTLAEETDNTIKNLKVVLPTGTSSDLFISWDAASNAVQADTNGYAVQWSDSQNDMTNVYKKENKSNKYGLNQMDGHSLNNLSIRAKEFENKIFYFRVYTYIKEDRDVLLTNGSKILKLDWKEDGTSKQEFLAANDPVIVATDTENNTVSYDFGNLSIATQNTYDTFAFLEWSLPTKLTKKEYDGFMIVIADNDTFSNPFEFAAGTAVNEAEVKGLKPSTQYFARGYFYKNSGGSKQKFGQGAIAKFTTIAPLSADKLAKFERLKTNKLITVPLLSVDFSKGTSSTTTTTDTSSTTNTTTTTISTTPTTTSTRTTRTTSRSTASASDIESFDVGSLTSVDDVNKMLKDVALLTNKLKNQRRKLSK